VPDEALVFSGLPAGRVWLRREDLVHPTVPGNKYRKLKYNLLEALKCRAGAVVSWGGAHSNHIAALAEAGRAAGLRTVGLIRGEEWAGRPGHSPTLQGALQAGMQLVFLSRADYRRRHEPAAIAEVQRRYPDAYLVPEGGSNAWGVAGCREILGPGDAGYDVICCAVGTGGTLAGLVESSAPHQRVIGFSALKGHAKGVAEAVAGWTPKRNWTVLEDDVFGGYARIDARLVSFLNAFRRETGIRLDPVYTGKMMFRLCALLADGTIGADERVLAIHTGGLQGIAGMNAALAARGQGLIEGA